MMQQLSRDDTQDPEWRLRTRVTAAILLSGVGTLFGFTLKNLLTGGTGGGSANAFALVFGPSTSIIAVAALVHPPLLYIVGPRRPLLTRNERWIGTGLVGVGLALGLVLVALWFGGRF